MEKMVNDLLERKLELYMICNPELHKATLNGYAHFSLHSHVLHIKNRNSVKQH
jgi:hypothetical protein